MVSRGRDHYVGIIDQGTNGTRFVVFNAAGCVVGDGFEELGRVTNAPARVEYDPVEIWQCVRAAMQRGIDHAGVPPKAFAAIGIANQRQTFVLWDPDTKEPLTPAISWQDRRACDLVGHLPADVHACIRDRTGLVPDPYFAGPTLAEVLREDRDLHERARHGDIEFGTIDTWLLSRLSGRHVTDATNAGQSMLADTKRLEWDAELLDLFDVPPEILPEIYPSSHPEAFGRTDVGGLLDTEIPITGVVGDQQAALLGHGGLASGATKISHGAGNFVLQQVGRERPDPDGRVLSTVVFQCEGERPYYGLEAPVFTSGAMIEWLCDMGMLQCEGGLVPTDVEWNGRTPTVVPAIAGGGAPHWTDTESGAIVGLGREDDPESVLMGTLVGIGFATRSALEAIEAVSGYRAETVHVDGAPVEDNAIAQQTASLLGRRLFRPALSQVAALGVAYAAGLAVDMWADPEDVLPSREGERFFPLKDQSTVDDRYRRWTDERDRVLARDTRQAED